MQNRLGVEGFAREDNLGAMGDYRKHAQDQPEAVEQWRRATQNIKRGEIHAITNKARVVNQVAAEELAISLRLSLLYMVHILMCQHCSFRIAC
jgi:predicted transcriptional regulator